MKMPSKFSVMLYHCNPVVIHLTIKDAALTLLLSLDLWRNIIAVNVLWQCECINALESHDMCVNEILRELNLEAGTGGNG